MGRHAHHALRWLGSAAAALILVAGFLLWRLMQGPIALDRLAPWVAAAVERSAPGWHVAIAGVRLGVDHSTHQLDLRVAGMRLSGKGGETLAVFPEVLADFSLRGLLFGRLNPTRIVIDRAALRFVREPGGALRLDLGGGDAGVPGFDFPQAVAAFGSLRQIAIREATVVLDDRASGRTWRANRVDMTAAVTPAGIDGDLSLALPIGAAAPELHAGYRYSAADHAVDLAVDIGALVPAALASLSPRLAALAAVDFPVSGSLETRLDVDALASAGFRLDLRFGRGAIKSPLFAQGPVAVAGGDMQLVYAPEASALRLSRLRLDLGDGPRIRAQGELGGVTTALLAGNPGPAPPLPGKLRIVLHDVPLARFPGLWPAGLSPGGRDWIMTNLHDGVLDEAAFDFAAALDPAAGAAEVKSTRGAMSFHDLTIDYFRGLPAVRKVAGSATLVGDRLEFTPFSGVVKSTNVTGGTVVITELGSAVETLAIDLALAGPIRDALEIIDAPPLRYARDIGVDPARLSGRADTRLHFKFPLLKELKLADVAFGAEAKLADVGFANIALDRDLSDGKFALDITRRGAQLKGEGRFDGIPASLDANLAFATAAGPHAGYRVQLTLDEAARRRLGLDLLPDRLAGPVGVDLTYSDFGKGRSEGLAQLDLGRAGLSVAEAGWKKAPDVAATARIGFDLQDEHLTRLSRVEIAAPGLDGRLAVKFLPDGKRIERIDVQRLAVGADDVKGSVARRPEGGWRVELTGPRLDIAELIGKRAGSHDAGDQPLQIAARLGRLGLGPKRELRDVSAELSRTGGHWRAAHVEARFANGHKLSLHLGPQAGKNHLSFTSDDLGASLALLDVTDNIVGGHVTVSGEDRDGAVRGHIEGGDYRLVRAPAFASVLSLASLGGVSNMLTGSGIPFSTLRGDFTWRDEQMAIEDLLAYGGAIGVTANGSLDLGGDRLDLQGTIVPAYTLNSVFGNVPVIGSLLLGGEGQGLFAANYHLVGPMAKPEVSVNPLSVLTPGFLRRLLQPNFGLPPPTADQPSPE